MLRVLVLLAGIVFLRTLLPRKPKLSPTQTSPSMNSLDGLLTAEQIRSALDAHPGLKDCEGTVATRHRK